MPEKQKRQPAYNLPGLPKTGRRCEFVLCEDPTTGEIIAVPGKSCPTSFVQHIADTTLEKGLVFRIPRIRVEVIDEKEGEGKEGEGKEGEV